ncbi:MAG: hypothetical protein ACJATD_000563 [Alloalcanivorax sp.]|jgi:hypothetical protein
MRFKSTDFFVITAFYTGIIFVYYVYTPGLSGQFIFDDLPNLSALGATGGVNDWYSLKTYLLSGFSGPTGRPLSLLSFLLDGNTWPVPSAEPFKRTNIFVHLLNGCLLFLVTLQIVFFYEKNRNGQAALSTRAKLTALFVSLLWMAHPYLVSTTLYVVQRMAQLPMLFTFLAIYLWLKVRPQISERPVWAYSIMVMVMGSCGLLAILSKENGVLLPLLIWVVEFTILGNSACPSLSRRWKLFFFAIPALCITGFLVYVATANGWSQDYPTRTFSPAERLLTEARVVSGYLYNWFVPQIYTTGVFHDDINVSESLVSPVSTLGATVVILGLCAIAVKFRKEKPLVSLAILFFFISQLVESTTVGLEIKFEHRVYIGSGFLFLPIVHGVLSRVSLSRIVPLTLVLFGLALFCWRGASLWGDYPLMVEVWSKKAPDSARAQVEFSSLLYNVGAEREALLVLNEASKRVPEDVYLRLTQLLAQCRVDRADEKAKQEVLKLAGEELYKKSWFNLMQKFMSWSNREDCRGLSTDYFISLLNEFLSQPRNKIRKSLGYSQLTYLKGISHLTKGDSEMAIDVIQESLLSRREVQKLMNIAGYFATYGHEKEALLYARQARDRLTQGKLHGRELAESPSLDDIDAFIHVLGDKLKK